jgi:hypothetical protein
LAKRAAREAAEKPAAPAPQKRANVKKTGLEIFITIAHGCGGHCDPLMFSVAPECSENWKAWLSSNQAV